MAEYKMVRLGDVCEIQSGGTPSRSKTEYWKDGTIPWVKIGDFSGKYLDKTTEHITQQGLDNSSAKLFSKGTILYSIFATLGEATILNIDATTNQAIAGIKIKDKSSVDIDYFYSFFKSLKDEVNRIGRGVAQNNINLSILKSFFIPLPPLETQKQIAAQLDKCTAVIAKHKQMLEKYDTLIKSRFIEMFGNPVQNSKGYKYKKLEELGKWESGGTPSRKNNDYFKGSIPWYSAGELNSLYLYDSNEKITETAIEESSAKLFRKGSLFVGMYDTAAFKMGIATTDCSSNQACANIFPNRDVNVIWLYYELMEMKKFFLQNRRGVRQKNLNLGMIKGFEIPYAPSNLQNDFAAFVQQIDKSKFEIANSLKRLYNKGMLS